MEKQIENEDYVQAGDLASVNILMQKQQVSKCRMQRACKYGHGHVIKVKNKTPVILQMIETQMAVKAKQVTELESQAQHLQQMDPEKGEEIVAKKSIVEDRFGKLQKPLLARLVRTLFILYRWS